MTQTAAGIARSVHYLHKSCPRRIIHTDIKPSNGLITKLHSDFGLAKWLPSQWSHHSIARIEETFGVHDPFHQTPMVSHEVQSGCLQSGPDQDVNISLVV